MQLLQKKPGWSVNSAHIRSLRRLTAGRTCNLDHAPNTHAVQRSQTQDENEVAFACKRASSRISFANVDLQSYNPSKLFRNTTALPLNRHAFITTRMQTLQIKMFWIKYSAAFSIKMLRL